jgi:hypothetical protein
LASFYFGVDRSQTNRWTKAFLLSLEKTLGIEIVYCTHKFRQHDTMKEAQINQKRHAKKTKKIHFGF